MQCHIAKKLIVESARGKAESEDQQALDRHILTCADCQKEQSHWLLLTRLGRLSPPSMSADSQRQMLQRLLRQAASQPSQQTPQRWGLRTYAALSVCAAAAVIALLFYRFDRNQQTTAQALRAPMQLAASAEGIIEMSGARVSYLSGTTLRIDDGRRELRLDKGEVDVDVHHGPPAQAARFRVLTARFVVEVWGTRFRVTPESVVTLRGHVKVLSLTGTELASLHAGERWQLPQTVAAEVEPPAPLAEVPAVPPAAPPKVENELKPVHPPRPQPIPDTVRTLPQPLPVRQKIALARSALADGNLVLARQKIADALKSDPSPSQRAALALLEADCLLSERRYPEAIVAYGTVSRQYPEDPSGETAAFALAQFLSERGSKDEARTALESYLLRYPSGRFVREVKEKLDRQSTAK